jgi:SAM-dependent methyltransferase
MTDTIAYTKPPAEEVPPPLALLEILNGMWVARAVQVAAELGLADLLAEGPRSVDSLAVATSTDVDALERLLRALSTVGIFAPAGPGAYAQTPRSGCLASGHPASMRNAARMFGADWQWRAWTALPDAIRSGGPAFDAAHGVNLLDYLRGSDPAAGELFDAAMLDMSAFLNRAVVAAYQLPENAVVIDVGGGHSTLLADLLQANPSTRGILLDVAAVAPRARALVEQAGVDERCRVEEGDFFSEVPAGGDLLVLNRVLHDWDDERALALLRACRRACGPDARLLIVEQLLEPDGASRRAAFTDLQMLVIRGGRERTATEYAELLERAGFVLDRILPTPSPMALLEAAPA